MNYCRLASAHGVASKHNATFELFRQWWNGIHSPTLGGADHGKEKFDSHGLRVRIPPGEQRSIMIVAVHEECSEYSAWF